MINFTVICLQPNCGDYRAKVNDALNMKLTISCLSTCVRMRKINKRMSKLLQEINLQVLRQPHRHPFRQTILYIINRRISNRQYRQDKFPNINCFQTKQESNVNQNPTFTSILNNGFSSNPIMPGGLFKRLRENDKF